MKAKIEFDDAALQRAFKGLEPKTFRTAVKSGMRRAVNVIKREAVKNYKREYPGSARFRGIHMKVWRTGMGAMVDLLFLKNDKQLRPWVMRFQNKGTAMRSTKKGLDRGFMSASYFFSDAISATKRKAESMMQRFVDEAIIKKARKEGFNV